MDNASLSFARMSMTSKLQRILHWVGSGLALIGIAFVALRLHGYWRRIDFSQFTVASWAYMIGLALLCGLANLLLALAWRLLLTQFGVQAARGWAIRTYGISQLAKYLPGNIFHLAGRQAIGMAAGVSGAALAKSALWELGLIAFAGSIYVLLVFPRLFEFTLLTSAVVFMGVASGSVYLIKKAINIQAARAFCLYTLFLAVSGAIFAALGSISASALQLGMQAWVLLGGAYVIAWLAGLVTPGAPAGVGVRELVLLLLAKGIMAESDLLLAILLGRIVTVAGDIIYFMFSAMIPGTSKL